MRSAFSADWLYVPPLVGNPEDAGKVAVKNLIRHPLPSTNQTHNLDKLLVARHSSEPTLLQSERGLQSKGANGTADQPGRPETHRSSHFITGVGVSPPPTISAKRL